MEALLSDRQKVKIALVHGIVAALFLLAIVTFIDVRRMPWAAIVVFHNNAIARFFVPVPYGLIIGLQKWRFFERPDTKIWLWPTAFLVPLLILSIFFFISGNISVIIVWLFYWAGPLVPLILLQTVVNYVLRFLHQRMHPAS